MEFITSHGNVFMTIAGWVLFLVSEKLAASSRWKANSITQLIKQGSNYLLGKKN